MVRGPGAIGYNGGAATGKERVVRAWRFHEFGEIGAYRLEDVPTPRPGPGEVLLRVRYAALNPADRLLIEGRYPGAGQLPLTVGRDGAGVVHEAQAGGRFRKGEAAVVLRSEIGVTRQGTLADFVVVPEDVLAPIPAGWSLQEAAAAPLVYLTAWKALVTQGGLKCGETVLVTGASGGVGIAAIQLAKALGARVIALSRDAAKRARLIALGADAALDDTAPDLAGQVGKASGGRGPDLVIEHLGGPRLAEHMAMASMNGRIMVIGLLAGRSVELDLGMLLFKQMRIEGVHVGKYAPAEAQDAWRRVVAAMDAAGARPVIDRIHPMEQVQEAFARLAGGHLGKVLVEVNTTD
jgi:NADPH2:quinone reductase